MVSLIKVYRQIARIFPKGYKLYVERKLVCSGYAIPPEVYIGFTFLLSLAISLAISLGLFVFNVIDLLRFLICIPLTFAVLFFVWNAIIILSADRKASFVEEILPDALQLMAANIRAGITPDRALLLSARPEFGPLEIEIKRAAKEALTGKSIEDALLEIPKRIESRTVARTIKLITEGLRSGGEFATLLDETANDVRQSQSIKKEIKANVAMYGMFIFFAAAFGAPLLYAISSYLVEMILRVGAATAIPEAVEVATIPIKFAAPNISSELLFNFSIAAIVITTSFGGVVIGLIEAGKEKAGLRFVFLLITIGLAVFFGARLILAMMFGPLA